MLSADPEYYQWTQWFFIQLFKMGLAYRKKAAVDWCPKDNTTLAREQVIGEDRHCERCGTPVIKKDLEQWFFRTTKYADELLDFSRIDWPRRSDPADQLDWAVGRRGGDLPHRPMDRETAIDRLHHPPRHAVGRHLHGLLARASAGGPDHHARTQGRGRGLQGAGRAPIRHRARSRRQGKDRRLHRRLRHQPGQQRAHPDLDRGLCADDLRHRRHHGRAGPRRARLRLRPQV